MKTHFRSVSSIIPPFPEIEPVPRSLQIHELLNKEKRVFNNFLFCTAFTSIGVLIAMILRQCSLNQDVLATGQR